MQVRLSEHAGYSFHARAKQQLLRATFFAEEHHFLFPSLSRHDGHFIPKHSARNKHVAIAPQLIIRTPSGDASPVVLDGACTVAQLKAVIENETFVPAGKNIIICHNPFLSLPDSRSLAPS